MDVIIGQGAVIGEDTPLAEREATVVGSYNQIPQGLHIGSGCVLYPHLGAEKLSREITSWEVVR